MALITLDPASKCPLCGGHLHYEEIGNYGVEYLILRTGKIAKKPIRRNIYQTSPDDNMVFCSNCSNAFNGHIHDDGHISIVFDVEDY